MRFLIFIGIYLDIYLLPFLFIAEFTLVEFPQVLILTQCHAGTHFVGKYCTNTSKNMVRENNNTRYNIVYIFRVLE